jgi:riboflavin synthase
MFTGMIEDIGRVTGINKRPDGMLLQIQTQLPMNEFQLGDSIAVNGACLTITNFQSDWFQADVSHESLKTTTLGDLLQNQLVHLERALSFGGRLGGHLVTGHVDGIGVIVHRQQMGVNLDLEILAPAEVLPYLVAKGSVAIAGVSLTINQPDGVRFRVTLVPHTLRKTNLGQLKSGERINLEADILGKYVRHFTGPKGLTSDLNEKFLSEHGFLD